MAKEMPHYVASIKDVKGNVVETRLIQAKSIAQAMNHSAEKIISVERATLSQVIDMTKLGVEVEVVKQGE